MLKLIKLPDLITIINALLGFTALLMMREEIQSAAVLILVAALADGLDGVIARRIEHGIFGVNLDSFADLISFGIAPAMAGYLLISEINPYISSGLAAIYMVCGILRLARFNISAKRKEFIGLPITASGICIALLIITRADPLILACSYPILSALMVSTVSYPKIRDRKVLIPIGIIFAFIIAVYCVRRTHLINLLLVMVTCYIISPLIWRAKHAIR